MVAHNEVSFTGMNFSNNEAQLVFDSIKNAKSLKFSKCSLSFSNTFMINPENKYCLKFLSIDGKVTFSLKGRNFSEKFKAFMGTLADSSLLKSVTSLSMSIKNLPMDTTNECIEEFFKLQASQP
mmetsp:Transcript_23326/g.26746  ORF Transcript_23326/g.26746 Transcript_23326/m.26746 type:complete len:124 (-) Transcript_23326:159-530(-)